MPGSPVAALRRVLLATLLAAALAACAGYGPGDVRPGQSAEEVARSMGAPTSRYTMPDGHTRLEYARGPAGRETFMIDLDAQGRVQQWAQVLDEPHFLRVVPGMSSDELLRLLGRPGERRPGGLRGGETWSWRYPTHDCLWIQVSIEADGRVRDGVSHALDPTCSGNDPQP
jgi:hypothetical protein